MNSIDEQLRELLSTRDDTDVPLNEGNYYREVWDSFKGESSAFFIFTWIGIIVFGGGLIYCIVLMFQAEDQRGLILAATLAIMLNSAQIALKLWYNMRLNRIAVLREIRRLRLEMAVDK
jgi:hypothetical protein